MKIGIIGGGQLGMMMAKAAIKLGHQIISLDPNPNCSITKYSELHLTYQYDDFEGIKRLIYFSDVLTYEFENVNVDVLKTIEKNLPQKIKALKISQNRLFEKTLAQSLDIPTPKFFKLENSSNMFYPAMIKTTTGGYDGIGQFKVKNESEFNSKKLNPHVEYIVEEFIKFDYEISVIATKDFYGNVVTFPIPINTHKNGILSECLIDNSLPKSLKNKAIEYTKYIINSLDYIGTLAVEFFVKGDELIFNEFAPRPHNSGHYTIEGCNVSQFENHILAITKQAILKPCLIKPTLMINVLGKNIEYLSNAKPIKNAYVHDYFKQDIRPKRKMGHITIMKPTIDECIKTKNKITGE